MKRLLIAMAFMVLLTVAYGEDSPSLESLRAEHTRWTLWHREEASTTIHYHGSGTAFNRRGNAVGDYWYSGERVTGAPKVATETIHGRLKSYEVHTLILEHVQKWQTVHGKSKWVDADDVTVKDDRVSAEDLKWLKKWRKATTPATSP